VEFVESFFYRSTDGPTRVDQIVKSSRTCYDDYVRELGSAFAGRYAGYIDHGNSTGHDLELNYGGNADRIAAIKKFRDPHNLFRLYLPNNMSNAPFNPLETSRK
jgi:hypothetical protein